MDVLDLTMSIESMIVYDDYNPDLPNKLPIHVHLVTLFQGNYTKAVFKKIHLPNYHPIDNIYTDTFWDTRDPNVTGEFIVKVENGWLKIDIDYRSTNYTPWYKTDEELGIKCPPLLFTTFEVRLTP